jgi:hypothetical protein
MQLVSPRHLTHRFPSRFESGGIDSWCSYSVALPIIIKPIETFPAVLSFVPFPARMFNLCRTPPRPAAAGAKIDPIPRFSPPDPTPDHQIVEHPHLLLLHLILSWASRGPQRCSKLKNSRSTLGSFVWNADLSTLLPPWASPNLTPYLLYLKHPNAC